MMGVTFWVSGKFWYFPEQATKKKDKGPCTTGKGGTTFCSLDSLTVTSQLSVYSLTYNNWGYILKLIDSEIWLDGICEGILGPELGPHENTEGDGSERGDNHQLKRMRPEEKASPICLRLSEWKKNWNGFTPNTIFSIQRKHLLIKENKFTSEHVEHVVQCSEDCSDLHTGETEQHLHKHRTQRSRAVTWGQDWADSTHIHTWTRLDSTIHMFRWDNDPQRRHSQPVWFKAFTWWLVEVNSSGLQITGQSILRGETLTDHWLEIVGATPHDTLIQTLSVCCTSVLLTVHVLCVLHEGSHLHHQDNEVTVWRKKIILESHHHSAVSGSTRTHRKEREQRDCVVSFSCINLHI